KCAVSTQLATVAIITRQKGSGPATYDARLGHERLSRTRHDQWTMRQEIDAVRQQHLYRSAVFHFALGIFHDHLGGALLDRGAAGVSTFVADRGLADREDRGVRGLQRPAGHGLIAI